MNTITRSLWQVDSALRRGPARRVVQWKRHRGLRASDVFLASYPKSGNTWLRHLLAISITGTTTAWRGDIQTVSRPVGDHSHLPDHAADGGRLVKTHEPFRPAYRRGVYLVRDPRDVVTSEYEYQRNYSRRFAEYGGSFDAFVERFAQGTVNSYGSWGDHVRSWHRAVERGDILLLRFEDLRQDPRASLLRALDYIGIEAIDRNVDLAIDDTRVDAMKAKEALYWSQLERASPNFVRQGAAGGWRSGLRREHADVIAAAFAESMAYVGYSSDPR